MSQILWSLKDLEVFYCFFFQFINTKTIRSMFYVASGWFVYLFIYSLNSMVCCRIWKCAIQLNGIKLLIFSSTYCWNFPWVVLDISVNGCLSIIMSGFLKVSQNKGYNNTNTATTTRTKTMSRTTAVLTCKTPLESYTVISTDGQKIAVYNKRQTSTKEILPTSQQTFIFRQQFLALLTMSYFSSHSLQHRRAHDIWYPALYNRSIRYCTHFCKTRKESNTSGSCPVTERARVVTIHFGANTWPAVNVSVVTKSS
jgi:hypothetical protein